MAECRQKVLVDPTIPARQVYDLVLEERQRNGRNNNEPGDEPEFDSIRSNIVRARAALVPPIPATLADVDIQGEWSQSWVGER